MMTDLQYTLDDGKSTEHINRFVGMFVLTFVVGNAGWLVDRSIDWLTN